VAMWTVKWFIRPRDTDLSRPRKAARTASSTFRRSRRLLTWPRARVSYEFVSGRSGKMSAESLRLG
jgi:hypothetical protein